MEILVSIIIPIYNVENYLEDCVESVKKQTYKNVEIILVDDGSTDNSGEICDKYEKLDERIKVFHKSNGGLSDARNVGIEKATGQFICFLDSDDMLSMCAIEEQLNACLKSDADICIGGLKKFSDSLPQDICNKDMKDTIILDKIETTRRMLLHNGFGHEACGKLYKKELWKDERFPKGKLYEDYATIYKVVSKCNKCVILKQKVYWYRVRAGSIMKSKLTHKNMQLLSISEEVTSYIKYEMPEVENEARYLQMVTYLKLMKGILDINFSAFPEEQRKIEKYIISCQALLKMNFVKRKDKIKAKSFLVSKYLFYAVYMLGEKTHL